MFSHHAMTSVISSSADTLLTFRVVGSPLMRSTGGPSANSGSTGKRPLHTSRRALRAIVASTEPLLLHFGGAARSTFLGNLVEVVEDLRASLKREAAK